MVVIMVVWIPSAYLTDDIPLDIYENKNHRPYMDIKDWAKDKWLSRGREISN